MFETEKEAEEEYEKLKDMKAKIIYQNFAIKDLVRDLDEEGEPKLIKELKEYAA